MQSQFVALLASQGSPEATLLVRRANGQFALGRIDARLALAARAAASYPGTPSSGSPAWAVLTA